MGKAPDEKFIKQISDFVLENQEINEIEEISVHNYGPHRSAISMRVYISPDFKSDQINDIVSRIEKSVERKFKCDIIIQAK